MIIKFPKNIGQRYYQIHYQFVLDLFKEMKAEIELVNFTKIDDRDNLFLVEINGKLCIFDFEDFPKNESYINNIPIFKFHLTEPSHNLFSFSPVSFNDWEWYNNVGINLHYKAEGFISNRQRPYAGAKERRTGVHKLLQNEDVRFAVIDQKEFWNEVEDITVSVCVPGACNNMLDRGQLQYMALGACTISPYLPEILPFDKKLIPGVHYIQCQDNYYDLLDQIAWCKENRKICFEIGLNAEQLFLETCHPAALKKWIEQCLGL